VFLPIMTRPVETTRYQVERADLPRLIERLERVWMPRTRALVSFGAVGPPARRLFGFPYAGGSSVAYRDWPSALPGTDVWAVELPGRGRLFGQPALRRLPEIVDYAVAAIEPRTESPFAVHGHSLGAATALEVTRALVQRGRPPLCLIVTGAAAPHLPSRRARPLHSLPRWELLDALEDLETLPEALRARPDVLDAFLPTIRADMESRETWRAEIGDIQVPIHAFSGRDDQHVSFEELKEWRRHTSGPFLARQLEGGHFFIKSREDVFLPLVRQILESHAATGGVDREHHLPG
jgi:surfactin synthase thioesterase subunit